MMGRTTIFYSLVAIAFSVTLSACGWQRPYHPTPLEALTEFPGYLTADSLSTASVLREEQVAGGLVLLYQYPLDTAGTSQCLATTFVTQENNDGWRAQSASKLGCGAVLATEFAATFTVGGNVTDLTTVYGLAQVDGEIRVEWSDGKIDRVPIEDGTFLKSRPETLSVRDVELLNEAGVVLESVTWANGARPTRAALTLTPVATAMLPPTFRDQAFVNLGSEALHGAPPYTAVFQGNISYQANCAALELNAGDGHSISLACPTGETKPPNSLSATPMKRPQPTTPKPLCSSPMARPSRPLPKPLWWPCLNPWPQTSGFCGGASGC